MTVIGTGAAGLKDGNGGGQIDYDKNAVVASLIPSLLLQVKHRWTSMAPARIKSMRAISKFEHLHRDIDNTSAETVADHDDGDAELVLASTTPSRTLPWWCKLRGYG